MRTIRIQSMSGQLARRHSVMVVRRSAMTRLALLLTLAALVLGPVAPRSTVASGSGLAVNATSAATGAPSVEVVGSTTAVRRHQDPAGSASASLTAARNEFESFQVVIHAGAQTLTGVGVALKAPAAGVGLTGPNGATIPAGNVTIYREEYYHVQRPSDGELWAGDPCPAGGDPRECWLPDALIPETDPFYNEDRNAFPITIPAGENRVAWVDVLVPRGQTPGNYTGALAVTATDVAPMQVGIALKVIDFELPSTSSVRGTFSTWRAQLCRAHDGCPGEIGSALYSLYLRAALDNRVTLSTPALYGPTQATYGTDVLPLLNGTAPTRLPGARLTDITLNLYEASAVGQWKARGLAGGFADRITFYCDEMGRDPARWTAECNTPYGTARDAWNSTGANIGPLPVAQTGNKANLDWAIQQGYEVAAAINTLIPLVNHMHPKGGASTRSQYEEFLDKDRAHNRLWMYQSCMSSGCDDPNDPADDFSANTLWNGWPSYHIDQPPSEARAMPWLLFKYDATGEYYFQTFGRLPQAWNDCANGQTSCQYSEGGNGDGTLFYPGKPGACAVGCIGGTKHIPVESIRLKRIRDGREDYEYLKWLQDHNKGAEARAVVDELFPSMYDTNKSQALLDAARGKLIDLVAPGDPQPDPGKSDLRVVGIEESSDPATVGNDITYTMKVTNDGPDASSGAMLMLHRLGLRFVSIQSTHAHYCDSNGCKLDGLPVGETATMTFVGVSTTARSVEMGVDVEESTDPDLSDNSGAETTTVIGRDCTPELTGTPGNDVLTGTTGNDVICGLGGNDTISASGGNDTVYGGAGADRIDGGDGNDLLIGGPNDDILDGGTGVDAVSYEDAVSGVVVNLLQRDAYDNQYTPGEAGIGYDAPITGIENVYGSAYSDAIVGSTGPNAIYALGGNDSVQGWSGNDTIYAGGGDDPSLQGNDGNDLISGGPGNDKMYGGAGTDTASYRDATSRVDVSLTNHNGAGASVGTDTLSADIENVAGSPFDDAIAGDGLNNVIDGGTGNDTINSLGGNDTVLAREGNDLLLGGMGNDTIDGGLGSDRVSYQEATAGVTLNLGAGTATGEGADTLRYIEHAIGSFYNDAITGSVWANMIQGSKGSDTILGMGGNDGLYGNESDDTLRGGDGNDGFNGGLGTDTCDQGAGSGAKVSCER